MYPSAPATQASRSRAWRLTEILHPFFWKTSAERPRFNQKRMDRLPLDEDRLWMVAKLALGKLDERTYRTHFGISLPMTTVVWAFLVSRGTQLKPLHLFWTLYFLKCYPLQDVACARFSVDHKTWTKWVWIGIQELFDALKFVCVL